MLINCPECGREISSAAICCPGCGFPINPEHPKKTGRRKSSSKLPNGYGSVYKLSGNRRNPFIAVKTVGWSADPDTGKVKQNKKTIGYFPNRSLAMDALAQFNANPYDLDSNKITFEELYKKWSEEYFKTIKSSSARTVIAAHKYCSPLFNMRMKDIRPIHMESTISDAQVGDSTKARMKSLFNLLFRYALKNEIVDKDYAALCDSVKRPERKIERIPFSDDELKLLWNNLDFPFVDMILIGIYTGFRPQELCLIKLENINLSSASIMGGMKTEAGTDRIVPIHKKIYSLVEKNVSKARNLGSEFLFNDPNGQQGINITYDKYRGRYKKVISALNLNSKHRPHDTRHTFITRWKLQKLDDNILSLIVGHALVGIAENVYTHRHLEDLKKEMDLLDF